jgi:hypothetical protein
MITCVGVWYFFYYTYFFMVIIFLFIVTSARYAAAWIVGEFARSMEGVHPTDILGALLQPQAAALPPHIQSVFMQNALKIFAFIVAAAYNVLPPLEDDEHDETHFEDITPETIDQANNMLTQSLTVFTHSVHLEVQERACFALEILKLYSTLRASSSNEDIAAELAVLFDGTLNPVAKGAQRKVTVPEGVDLDSQINPPDEEEENPFEEEDDDIIKHHSESEEARSTASGSEDNFASTPTKRSITADIARNRELRLQRNANNPFMLASSKSARKPVLDDHASSPPVATLSSSDLGIGLVVGNKDDLVPKKKRGGKVGKVYTVKRDEDAPEGGDDDNAEVKKVPSDALSAINLDDPLGIDEVLPVARHRTDIEQEKKVSHFSHPFPIFHPTLTSPFKQATAAAAAAKEKARSRREGEKERPGRDGRERHGKEGRDERHRRPREGREGEKRGEDRPRRPKAQTEGQLIDIGLDIHLHNPTMLLLPSPLII